MFASNVGKTWRSGRLAASANPCAIKDGARLGTLSYKPCPLRMRESAEYAERVARRSRISRLTRLLLRGCGSGVLKLGSSTHSWGQSSYDASSLLGSMLSATLRSAGTSQQLTVRQWLYEHRWVLAANTACTLQMVQWAMDDALYLRSINMLAICFFTAYNYNKGAWIYISWDAAYTLINMVQISRILRERRQVSLLPWQREVHEAVFEQAGLSTRQTRSLLEIAEAGCLLRPGERFEIAKGAPGGAEAGGRAAHGRAASHPVGLVLSGELKVETEDGQIVGFVDEHGWYGHVQYNLEAHPRVILTALQPTRVLQWSSARLADLLRSEPLIDKGVHVLWNRDMGRALSQRDDEYIRRRRAHYGQVLRALTASCAQLQPADVAFVQAHRKQHAIDDQTHELSLDELSQAGALEPHALLALRGLRLEEGDGESESGRLPLLSRLRRLFSSSLSSVSDMASELSLAASSEMDAVTVEPVAEAAAAERLHS